MIPAGRARAWFARHERPPFFRAAWDRVLMIHYAVSPAALAPLVPFELDTFGGDAWVSLVAFTLRDLRFGGGGPSFSTHPFLNVRTYTRRNGIFFLAEWLPNPLCVLLGPRLYGLPYRRGRIEYRHEPPRLRGRVEGRGGALAYSARLDEPRFGRCPPGGLDEFLMERYTAFTRRGSADRCFRVWHPPWFRAPVAPEIGDDRLVASTGAWFRRARLTGAHYSAGFDEVWMSRPGRIEP